jgi:hypothetical protein
MLMKMTPRPQNGRAEIEERALVLRETTRAKERAAKALEACIIYKDGRKLCNVDRVGGFYR